MPYPRNGVWSSARISNALMATEAIDWLSTEHNEAHFTFYIFYWKSKLFVLEYLFVGFILGKFCEMFGNLQYSFILYVVFLFVHFFTVMS